MKRYKYWCCWDSTKRKLIVSRDIDKVTSAHCHDYSYLYASNIKEAKRQANILTHLEQSDGPM